MTDSQEKNSNIKSLRTKWLSWTLLFFILYATLRYIVFKGVDPVHFPLYIVNKIISISGIFFLAASYAIGKAEWLSFESKSKQNQLIKYLGLVGFSLISMHVFISLIIISPEYFPKFYEGNMLNFKGELSMLMGVFSLFCFTIPAIATIPFMQEAVGIKKWQKGQRMGYLGLLTSLFHTGVMGVSGWIDIEKWPGYLPPITLIGTIIAIIPLYLKFVKKNSG